MDTIWKYTLEPITVLTLPRGAIPLTVQCQDDVPQLWVLLNTDESARILRTFVSFATGQPILPKASYAYIATFQMQNGLVFHVFEESAP